MSRYRIEWHQRAGRERKEEMYALVVETHKERDDLLDYIDRTSYLTLVDAKSLD